MKTITYLKGEFEMKDLGKIKFYLGIQIEYFLNGKTYPSINIHRKGLEAFLNGQCLSFECTYGCSII